MKLKGIDRWNLLVKIKNNKNIKKPMIRETAESLLRSLNTASGIRVHGEIDTFIEVNKKYLQRIRG